MGQGDKELNINELIEQIGYERVELLSVDISDKTLPVIIFNVNDKEMKYGLSDVMLLALLRYLSNNVYSKSDAVVISELDENSKDFINSYYSIKHLLTDENLFCYSTLPDENGISKIVFNPSFKGFV